MITIFCEPRLGWAIEQGAYPLVPSEIADGIIAAGLFQSAGE